MQLQQSAEPIPGYTIRERIGAGGYGEVWLADAPGGLQKAIKFVYGYLDEQRGARELKALDRIKQVRHPFLLSLERIEVVDGQLVIVTELAESSMKERFEECVEAGQTGIDRTELLTHTKDVADALDFMSDKHSLQHLDVKPENILLVGGRVKVADFGLVKEIREVTASLMGGLTPLYAPPEVFDNRPSRHSDQYSLAIVYQEMLTGVLPFPGRTAAQLAAQHMSSRPRLDALPAQDRPIIARALEKDPSRRFSCCRELAEHLLNADRKSPETNEPAQDAAGRRRTSTSLRVSRPAHSESYGRRSRTNSMSLAERRLSLLRKSLTAEEHKQALDESVSGVSLSEVLGEAEVEHLPPLDLRDEKPVFQPTVFVGIGGFAGSVLRQLRRRLHTRLGPQGVPAQRLLLLDSDGKSIMRAMQGEDVCALESEETLALPLRRSQAYRKVSKSYFQWLSRRWLFNIPRSLLTEGMRPLGRLALADHADEVMERLKTLLAAATDPQTLEAAAEAAQMPLCPRPRVVLTASITGGAGGGMVLDAAYMARQAMEELGLGEGEVLGMLAHGVGRNLAKKELGMANTYATLMELFHFNCSMGGYPGDPSCGLAPALAEQPTFDHTYLVHLGHDLGENDFTSSANELAEYLYRDAATPIRAFFTASRCAKKLKPIENQAATPQENSPEAIDGGGQDSPIDQSSNEPETPVDDSASSEAAIEPADALPDPAAVTNLAEESPSEESLSVEGNVAPPAEQAPALDAPPPFQLRTMGLHRLDIAPDEIINAVTDRVCRNLVHFWRGAPLENDPQALPPTPTRAGPSHTERVVNTQEIDRFGKELCTALSLNVEELTKSLSQGAAAELEGDPAAFFESCFAKLVSPETKKISVGKVIESFDELFGPPKMDEALKTLKDGSLLAGLVTHGEKLISKRAEVIRQWVLDLLDRSNARTAGALHAAQWCGKHLLQLEQEAGEAAKTAALEIQQLEQSLGRTGLKKANPSTEVDVRLTAELAQKLLRYPRLRLASMCAGLAERMVRRLRDESESIEQAVQAVRRELKLFKDEKLPPVHEMIQPPEEEENFIAARFWNKAHEHMEELVIQLERRLREDPHGPSLLVLSAEEKYDFRKELLPLLQRGARRAVLSVLSEIDVAAALLETRSIPSVSDENDGGESSPESKSDAHLPETNRSAKPPLENFILAAAPRLLACGGQSRMLAILPEGSDIARLEQTIGQKTGQTPTVLIDQDRDAVVCFEVAGLSPHDAADVLISGHEEYAQAARRLHTRVDIDWIHWN